MIGEQNTKAIPSAQQNRGSALVGRLADLYRAHLQQHEIASSVGWLLPLDDNYPIEIPLGLLRNAYELMASDMGLSVVENPAG